MTNRTTPIGPNTYTTHSLARLAGTADPDSDDSPGADLLHSVADGVAELIEKWDGATPDNDAGDLSQIADEAPNPYRFYMWREFVDLCAYNEDPSELGADCSDMEKAARICLYMIAERLAAALVAEYDERDSDDDDDEEESAT
jgi:hypothetical protein